MPELTEREFSSVLSLYSQSPLQFPLIRAVLEGQQDGRVFQGESGGVLVVTRFGFVQFFGADPDLDREVEDLIFDDSDLKDYLLWYDPPGRWREKMAMDYESAVRGRGRAQCHLVDFQPSDVLPIGYTLRWLSEPLLGSLSPLGLDIGTKFWNSRQDFLDHGFGFCVLYHGEQVVSVCYSACVAGGVAEIDVVTVEEHRRRGLAALVVSTFVGCARGGGVEPSWDCFAENKASLNLAEKLGFQPRAWYEFYSIDRKKL